MCVCMYIYIYIYIYMYVICYMHPHLMNLEAGPLRPASAKLWYQNYSV